MFTNGENLTAKTPPGDFQVTTREISLLSQQAITSKGISVPYTNLHVRTYVIYLLGTYVTILCNWLIL